MRQRRALPPPQAPGIGDLISEPSHQTFCLRFCGERRSSACFPSPTRIRNPALSTLPTGVAGSAAITDQVFGTLYRESASRQAAEAALTDSASAALSPI